MIAMNLAPCPLCNSPAEMLDGAPYNCYAVQCTSRTCFLSLGIDYDRDGDPAHDFYSELAAALAWNVRPRPVVYGVVQMTEARARELLAEVFNIGGKFQHPAALQTGVEYASWSPDDDDHSRPRIDGHFTPDQLEAIAWWVRNNAAPGSENGDTAGGTGK